MQIFTPVFVDRLSCLLAGESQTKENPKCIVLILSTDANKWTLYDGKHIITAFMTQSALTQVADSEESSMLDEQEKETKLSSFNGNIITLEKYTFHTIQRIPLELHSKTTCRTKVDKVCLLVDTFHLVQNGHLTTTYPSCKHLLRHEAIVVRLMLLSMAEIEHYLYTQQNIATSDQHSFAYSFCDTRPLEEDACILSKEQQEKLNALSHWPKNVLEEEESSQEGTQSPGDHFRTQNPHTQFTEMDSEDEKGTTQEISKELFPMTSILEERNQGEKENTSALRFETESPIVVKALKKRDIQNVNISPEKKDARNTTSSCPSITKPSDVEKTITSANNGTKTTKISFTIPGLNVGVEVTDRSAATQAIDEDDSSTEASVGSEDEADNTCWFTQAQTQAMSDSGEESECTESPITIATTKSTTNTVILPPKTIVAEYSAQSSIESPSHVPVPRPVVASQRPRNISLAESRRSKTLDNSIVSVESIRPPPISEPITTESALSCNRRIVPVDPPQPPPIPEPIATELTPVEFSPPIVPSSSSTLRNFVSTESSRDALSVFRQRALVCAKASLLRPKPVPAHPPSAAMGSLRNFFKRKFETHVNQQFKKFK